MKRLKIIVVLLMLAFAGVAVSGWIWCPSPAERANAITREEIEKAAKASETSKKMAKAGQELAAAPFGSAEREEKLKALIGLFDPDTQAYINALPREDRIGAIALKIKEENAAKEKEIAREKAKERLCWCLTFGKYQMSYQ
jgi:hypothetical protein